jgi:hypothetical protein
LVLRWLGEGHDGGWEGSAIWGAAHREHASAMITF